MKTEPIRGLFGAWLEDVEVYIEANDMLYKIDTVYAGTLYPSPNDMINKASDAFTCSQKISLEEGRPSPFEKSCNVCEIVHSDKNLSRLKCGTLFVGPIPLSKAIYASSVHDTILNTSMVIIPYEYLNVLGNDSYGIDNINHKVEYKLKNKVNNIKGEKQ